MPDRQSAAALHMGDAVDVLGFLNMRLIECMTLSNSDLPRRQIRDRRLTLP
jgi:hypothetical protein